MILFNLKNYILLFFFILANFFCNLHFSYAKELPPGTGSGDVPANILLMLDTSGSMGWPPPGAVTSYTYRPTDVDVDSNGNVYILEYQYCRIKKFDSGGSFLKSWGYCSRSTQNNSLYLPEGIAINESLNEIVVTNTQGGRYGRGNIKILDLDLNYKRTIADFNSTSCSNSGDNCYPIGVAWDSNNYIYYTSWQTKKVHKINSDGAKVLDIGSGYGTGSGQMLMGYHLDIDSNGNIYVADYYNHYVLKFNSSGSYVTRWGGYGYSNGQFLHPAGIAVDSNDNIFVSQPAGWSTYGHRVQKFNSSLSFQVSIGGQGSSDGKFYYPFGLAIDGDDKLYVADYWNNRVSVLTNAGVFVEHYGRGIKRINIMKKVIRKILSDQGITANANFGLMTWASNARMRVNVHENGADQILNMIDTITTGGWTNLGSAMSLAQQYFNGSNSPQDPKAADCENNFLIVISDGDWYGGSANSIAAQLYNSGNKPNVSTFVIGYAGYSNKNNYKALAKAGGTTDALYADTYQELYVRLSTAIKEAQIKDNLTFTSPAFKTETDSSGNKQKYMYQSTFTYVPSQQWEGQLKKFSLNEKNLPDTLAWDAGEELNKKNPDNRKIWTVGNGIEKGTSTTNNNFTTANIDYLYGPINSGSSLSTSDVESLINFVRGYDSYDEDKNNNTLDERNSKLADIFHSKLQIISPPSIPSGAESEKIKKVEEISNSEAAYRKQFAYESFRSQHASRKKIVLVGSNGGMLHAFDDASGEELWAFIPPNILPRLREIISSQDYETNSISGVDDTPVVKDIYYDHDDNGSKTWRTIALTGLGRGGKGLFALDITDTENPSHLFTIDNNTGDMIVTFWDADGEKKEFSYKGAPISQTNFDYSRLGNTTSTPNILRMGIDGTDKWVAVFGNGYNAVEPVTVHNGDGVTKEFRTSFSVNSKSDLLINIEGVNTTNYQLIDTSTISFNVPPNHGDTITIRYEQGHAGIFVLDLEDGGDENDNKGGKLIKYISLYDKDQKDRFNNINEEIVNSVPAKLSVIKADNIFNSLSSATYKGAMIYVVDIEGKLWKIDMTGNTASFKKNILFDAEADTVNQRYSFHALEAGVHEKNLWLAFGTGNMNKIALVDKNEGDNIPFVENRVYGIRDKNFPNFIDVTDSDELNKLNSGYENGLLSIKNCSEGGKPCPIRDDQIGWYANLNKDSSNKTNKNEKVTAKVTILSSKVLVPRYEPKPNDPCSAGIAKEGNYKLHCGNAVSGLGGTSSVVEMGRGVMSEYTRFEGDLFASISGKEETDKTYEEGIERKGQIIKRTAGGNTSGGEKVLIESWRELF